MEYELFSHYVHARSVCSLGQDLAFIKEGVDEMLLQN